MLEGPLTACSSLILYYSQNKLRVSDINMKVAEYFSLESKSQKNLC